MLPAKHHQPGEDQNGTRQQDWPWAWDADRRDGSLPGERVVGLSRNVTPAIARRSTSGLGRRKNHTRGVAAWPDRSARGRRGNARTASVRLPGRIVTKQATLGEADVVDEKQSEREADEARCDAELPVEPW
jgi:hypothetical protein